MHTHKLWVGILALGGVLILSCKQKEEDSSTDRESEERLISTVRRGDGLRSGGDSSKLSGRELVDRVERRARQLRGLENADLVGSVRRGLKEDEFLELSTLGNWEGDMDVDSAEAILLSHFREIGWSEALKRFDLIAGNLALSGPILSHIMEGVCERSPEEARKWLADHPEAPGATSAAATVGRAMADREGREESFDLIWNSQLPEAIRTNMLDGFASNWVLRDFDGAFQKLSSMDTDPLLDRTVYNLTSVASRFNAADTMPWAESISDAGLRRSAILETAKKWSDLDAESYSQWKESDAPADLRNELP